MNESNDKYSIADDVINQQFAFDENDNNDTNGQVTSNNNKVASASNVTSTWTDRSATMTSVTTRHPKVIYKLIQELKCLKKKNYGVEESKI